MSEKKRSLYECYSPKAILLGAEQYDCSEPSKTYIETYYRLSTEFRPASWEEVADELGMPKDKSTQFKIIASLNLAAQAYRNLCNQPEPYVIREPEE